jgi:RNA polymerase sigma factor
LHQVILMERRDVVASRPEVYVDRIQKGQDELRSLLIKQYKPFILAAAKRIVSVAAEGRDEFSVALSAFNEAIDKFDAGRHRSFLTFCDLVINRRLIDYIRKDSRRREYPFTYFDAKGNESLMERMQMQHADIMEGNAEIKDEIQEFSQNLQKYGITLEDLVRLAPRHTDSKLMCISLARRISSSPELMFRLEETGMLPINDLLREINLSRKTVERNRKFIIALCLVLTSGMETIKGYVQFVEEGAAAR